MNEHIRRLALEARLGPALLLHHYGKVDALTDTEQEGLEQIEKFAELIIEECINKIETHEIPVGNSAAGEMACEWTYAALKEIRDEIKQHFGVEE
jgi:hypothetical protein